VTLTGAITPALLLNVQASVAPEATTAEDGAIEPCLPCRGQPMEHGHSWQGV
jgi:hypothetical protein